MSEITDKDDYQTVRDEFSWSALTHYNFATDCIDQWAQQEPDKRAMLWVDDHGTEQTYSFLDISIASKKAANILTSAGIKRGETVIIILSRQVAWWQCLTACIRAGFVASPGSVQLSAQDIAYRIGASKATCVITDVENVAKVDQIRADCPSLKTCILIEGEKSGWLNYNTELEQASPDFAKINTSVEEDALCYFTSGTTGYPKMAIHSHSYAYGHQMTGKYWLDLTADDLHWNISDTGWAKAAWSSYFGPWLQGASLFIHHTSRIDAVKTLQMFARYPITTMCAAPTIYRMFVLQNLQDFKFLTLRHCVSAGEPLNPEVIKTWLKATNIEIKDGYGQTETVILCGSFPTVKVKAGSMGKPAPGIDLEIIDTKGNLSPLDEEGDIAVRVKPTAPIGLFKGYHGEKELTQKSFCGDWYLTGDRGRKDSEGYFWFSSRSDDVILSSGYRIGPFEVESALIEHEAVAESAVVSSPDETRGEVVKAFIVLVSGFTASDLLAVEIQNHVKSVTAPYKYPRKIEFVDQLPKTVSGKIRRVELRNAEWGKG